MKVFFKNILVFFLFLLSFSVYADDSNTGGWTLDKCIAYSLEKNISIRKANVSSDIYNQELVAQKGQRYPTLSASLSQGYSWSKDYNTVRNKFSDYASINATNASLSTGLTLYNGGKINNGIKQAKLNYQASLYDAATQKEDVTLSVLNAFLFVIYDKELVKNCKANIEDSESQLEQADAKVKQGLLSKADYLEVKAQLADEKLSLAEAASSYEIDKLSLKQLMELSASTAFEVKYPDISSFADQNLLPNAETVYNIALQIKPQVKSADLVKQMSMLDQKIAKSGYSPKLTLNGGLNTLYSSSYNGLGFDTQFQNRLAPSVDVTLSIPILQQNQVKSEVQIAKLNTKQAMLDEINTRNELRKDIEQACLDVSSAQIKYKASLGKFDAVKEAYDVATDKFNLGLISSTDFVTQKTKYINAESDLLQAKLKLIFSYKVLDFYSGKDIRL